MLGLLSGQRPSADEDVAHGMTRVFKQKHENVEKAQGIVGNKKTGGMGVGPGHWRAFWRAHTCQTGGSGQRLPVTGAGWKMHLKPTVTFPGFFPKDSAVKKTRARFFMPKTDGAVDPMDLAFG